MSSDRQMQNALREAFAPYAENGAIEVISLATSDGFPVYTYSKSGHSFEEDSLSAAASTLHSVSNAVARKILGKKFRVTFIEAEQGNVAFVDIDIQDKNYVLVMSADESMNIANLRLLINRLAKEIHTFSNQTLSAS